MHTSEGTGGSSSPSAGSNNKEGVCVLSFNFALCYSSFNILFIFYTDVDDVAAETPPSRDAESKVSSDPPPPGNTDGPPSENLAAAVLPPGPGSGNAVVDGK
jgi:hypothetical protein